MGRAARLAVPCARATINGMFMSRLASVAMVVVLMLSRFPNGQNASLTPEERAIAAHVDANQRRPSRCSSAR